MNMEKVWEKIKKADLMDNYFGYETSGFMISYVFIGYNKSVIKNIFDEDLNRIVRSIVCTINFDIEFHECEYDDKKLETYYELSFELPKKIERYIINFSKVINFKDLENTVEQDIKNIGEWLNVHDRMLTDSDFKVSDDETISDFIHRLRSKLEKDGE